MARTAKKSDDSNKLDIVRAEGKSEARALADVGIDPNAHAAITSQIFCKGTFGALSVTDTFKAVHEATELVGKGDMSGLEQMLAAQAISLNAIFTEMARRSALNMGEYIKASESYMRLALKAQAQCRSTIETLAAMKNPPVVFARQANIANGPQQVNNHGAAPIPRADESIGAPNKLLETDNGKRLDGGTSGTSIGGDRSLEALGEGHRADNGSGEGRHQPERLQGRETRRAA